MSMLEIGLRNVAEDDKSWVLYATQMLETAGSAAHFLANLHLRRSMSG